MRRGTEDPPLARCIPATTFVITRSPSRSNRRDGLSFLGNAKPSDKWSGYVQRTRPIDGDPRDHTASLRRGSSSRWSSVCLPAEIVYFLFFGPATENELRRNGCGSSAASASAFDLSPASARLKQPMAIEFGPRELLTGYTIRRHFEANKQRPHCCSAMGASMKGAFARSTEGANMLSHRDHPRSHLRRAGRSRGLSREVGCTLLSFRSTTRKKCRVLIDELREKLKKVAEPVA